MKTKTLVLSTLFLLTISCGSNSPSLPNYQDALAACKASSCPTLTAAKCDAVRTDFTNPGGGAAGKSSACADGLAAVSLTCIVQNCRSASLQTDVTNCVNAYQNQLGAICQ